MIFDPLPRALGSEAILHAQVHAPTCVTHCTAARLCTSAGEPGFDPRLLDLVIANSTALQVFSVRCIRHWPCTLRLPSIATLGYISSVVNMRRSVKVKDNALPVCAPHS